MSSHKNEKLSLLGGILIGLALLYIFLVGISCLSGGIKSLGAGVMDQYFTSSMNPILGLLVGILATTLVQSSSVTTSLIVGLVGAGQISVAAAVPMIMGANIGTTVTNTIASLAHATQDTEFRRAFSAATCHDFFNFLSVLVLLPVELLSRHIFGTGMLEKMAYIAAEWTIGTGGVTYKSPLKNSLKVGANFVKRAVTEVSDDGKWPAILLAVAGGIIILVSLMLIVKVMRNLVVSRMENYVNRFLGSGGALAILVGIVMTVMAQSSSITTSVMVPLAGAGMVTLRQIYPITLGANIGTTVTALLASMAIAGDTAMAARQVALVHLFFNLVGIAIWFVPPKLREVPLQLAEWMGDFATRSKKMAVVYVALVFYVLPAVIFFVSEAFSS